MQFSTTFLSRRLPGAKARRLASTMPDVIARGGIYDSRAWAPALAAAGVEQSDTRVFADGANVLVLVNERWLLKPETGGRWIARLWLGPREARELLLAADDDEALDSVLSMGTAHLYRRAPVVAPVVLVAAAYGIKIALKVAGHDALTFLPF
jgi:hypothetical protein